MKEEMQQILEYKKYTVIDFSINASNGMFLARNILTFLSSNVSFDILHGVYYVQRFSHFGYAN